MKNKEDIMFIDKKIIKALAEFMPTSDIRYYLNGMHVEVTGGDVRLTVSNGHSMATYTTELNPDDCIDMDIIIPQDAIRLAIKEKGWNMLKITPDKISSVGFEPIDSKFPDAAKVWPKEGTTFPSLRPDVYNVLAKSMKHVDVDGPDLWPADQSVVFRIGDIRGIIMGFRTSDKQGSMPNY